MMSPVLVEPPQVTMLRACLKVSLVMNGMLDSIFLFVRTVDRARGVAASGCYLVVIGRRKALMETEKEIC